MLTTQNEPLNGEHSTEDTYESPTPAFDLITMGRSSIDLYSNDVGAPFEEITSFAAYVGGSPTNIAVGGETFGARGSLTHRRR